jgi:hypothetical protein
MWNQRRKAAEGLDEFFSTTYQHSSGLSVWRFVAGCHAEEGGQYKEVIFARARMIVEVINTSAR